MGEHSKQPLPDSVRSVVESLVEELAAIVHGDEDTARQSAQTAAGSFDRALRAAMSERPGRDILSFNSSIEEGVGRNIKAHRNAAGWSLAQVAEQMRTAFPKWSRVTQAEVEHGPDPDGKRPARRMSWEELCVMAALFGVPVLALVLPPDEEHVHYDIGGRVLSPAQLVELLLGEGGQLGAGGPAWTPALLLTDQMDARPAPDFHGRTR